MHGKSAKDVYALPGVFEVYFLISTIVGILISPVAVMLLLPTTLRKSLPLVAVLALACSAVGAALVGPIGGGLGLVGGVAAMVWSGRHFALAEEAIVDEPWV